MAPANVAYLYRVPQKKRYIAFCSYNQLYMLDLTFPQVFRNQNFEPVPTSHLTDTLLESDMAQKRAHGHSFFLAFF